LVYTFTTSRYESVTKSSTKITAMVTGMTSE